METLNRPKSVLWPNPPTKLEKLTANEHAFGYALLEARKRQYTHPHEYAAAQRNYRRALRALVIHQSNLELFK